MTLPGHFHCGRHERQTPLSHFGTAMTDDKYQPSPSERANDTRLITPLALMGLIIAGGLLFASYQGGQSASTVTQAPATQTTR
jgi:hypothetical protein